MQKTTRELGYKPDEQIGQRVQKYSQKLRDIQLEDTLHLPVISLPDKTLPKTPKVLPKSGTLLSTLLACLKRVKRRLMSLVFGDDHWLM